MMWWLAVPFFGMPIIFVEGRRKRRRKKKEVLDPTTRLNKNFHSALSVDLPEVSSVEPSLVFE